MLLIGMQIASCPKGRKEPCADGAALSCRQPQPGKSPSGPSPSQVAPLAPTQCHPQAGGCRCPDSPGPNPALPADPRAWPQLAPLPQLAPAQRHRQAGAVPALPTASDPSPATCCQWARPQTAPPWLLAPVQCCCRARAGAVDLRRPQPHPDAADSPSPAAALGCGWQRWW